MVFILTLIPKALGDGLVDGRVYYPHRNASLKLG
jgi:hypothetical protein